MFKGDPPQVQIKAPGVRGKERRPLHHLLVAVTSHTTSMEEDRNMIVT